MVSHVVLRDADVNMSMSLCRILHMLDLLLIIVDRILDNNLSSVLPFNVQLMGQFLLSGKHDFKTTRKHTN